MICLSIYPVIWLCEQLGYLVNIVFPVGEKILSKGDASVDGRSSPEMLGKTRSWSSVSCGVGVAKGDSQWEVWLSVPSWTNLEKKEVTGAGWGHAV